MHNQTTTADANAMQTSRKKILLHMRKIKMNTAHINQMVFTNKICCVMLTWQICWLKWSWVVRTQFVRFPLISKSKSIELCVCVCGPHFEMQLHVATRCKAKHSICSCPKWFPFSRYLFLITLCNTLYASRECSALNIVAESVRLFRLLFFYFPNWS